MTSRNAIGLAIVVIALCSWSRNVLAASCVWKVTTNDGHSLYLGGSFHALRPSDYPLPREYNRVFDASSRLAFEDDPKTGAAAFSALMKAGEYPKGDNLKNHVDPRTYAYLRRFFASRNVPEEKFSRYRPWFLDILLSSPPPQYYQLGIENFLKQRAQATSKPIAGLETTGEHNAIFSGLNDKQAEALLLTLFINAGRAESKTVNMFDAWRRGDADLLARKTHESFSNFPFMAERLLDARNRNWIPKIENYLHSGQTYFVVVGAAHMGGSNGLISLLRQHGYNVEQL
jgi:uncharacterized protein YbaP (TraB family)